MPTLYDYDVQVDTSVQVDIELELSEIADLLEDEMADFLAAYVSKGDIVEAIETADYTADVFHELVHKLAPGEIKEELETYCTNHELSGESLKKSLRSWLAEPEIIHVTETPLAELFTMEEVATLESARRAVSAIHSLTLVEAVMQRNYAPGNPWLDTLNNLDALLEKIDPSKKETT